MYKSFDQSWCSCLKSSQIPELALDLNPPHNLCFPETSLLLAPTWSLINPFIRETTPTKSIFGHVEYRNPNSTMVSLITYTAAAIENVWQLYACSTAKFYIFHVLHLNHWLSVFLSFIFSLFFSLHPVCPLVPTVQRHPVLLNWSVP